MSRVFKPKTCERCDRDFVPRSSMSKWCDECLTVTCRQCGTMFTSRPIDILERGIKYCSPGCARAGRIQMNDIRLEGDLAYIVLTNRKREPVAEAVVDASDVPRVKSLGYRWHPGWCRHRRKWVAQARFKKDKKTTLVLLHRWLIDAPDGTEVDHINHDTLDNRRSNLRLVNRQKNSENRSGAYSTSRSGIRGVSWYEPSEKWRATVTVQGRQISLGYYDCIEEAERAVIAGRKRYMTHSEN